VGVALRQGPSAEAAATPASGPFTLPPLPYASDALEPHIDARTMEIHHGKHHAGYVANLNNAVNSQPDLAGKSISELLAGLGNVPEAVRTAVRNNGGGHFNHSLFWQVMSKSGGGTPGGELAKAIEGGFGSFDEFRQGFTKAAMGQFGSGWAWLVYDRAQKKLVIAATPNQDSPVMTDLPDAMLKRYGLESKAGQAVPILGVDVWEHAYYLKYQNRRADYVGAFFNVIDGDAVAERYADAQKS